jgi:alpha-beta hydrolase superfamily lysophospholipase
LKDIKQPTLILVGEEDQNVTSEISHRQSSEILADGIPDSKLVVLFNERHSYFTNPAEAHRIVRDFIRNWRRERVEPRFRIGGAERVRHGPRQVFNEKAACFRF